MTPRPRTIALALSLLVAACSNGAPIPVDPVVVTGQRTVASMLPNLTRSLTPAIAETTYGKPDEITGSGLLIYVYNVESGKRVFLSFPGFAPIMAARLQESTGASQELPLKD
jgi:hypothetical protein